MCLFKKKPFDPLSKYKLVFSETEWNDVWSRWMPHEIWGDTKKNVIWKKDCVAKLMAGPLHLLAHKNSSDIEPPNACGMIVSKAVYQYGYFEARVKVAPQGKKYWCAFWMYDPVKWEHGEIDVFEMMGDDSRYGTFTLHHWENGEHKVRSQSKKFKVDLSKDFHLFAVDWQRDYIDWYVDGYKVHSSYGNIPFSPMQMILNISSENTEYIFKPEDVPQFMYVDYVKVYQ